jgi:FkbM family methyltransferase
MAIVKQILEWLAPGDYVLDIGSNIGTFASDVIAAGYRVVLVEPNPKLVSVLRTKFTDSSVATIVPLGVGSNKGEMYLSICDEADTLSTFAEHWKSGRFSNYSWTERVRVSITTIDDLIEVFGTPRYIKIDVEGFELEVVSGLSSRAGIVSFEFTSEFIDHASKIVQLLSSKGYSKFNIAVGESTEFSLHRWVDSAHMSNIVLNNRSNKGLWGDIYAN